MMLNHFGGAKTSPSPSLTVWSARNYRKVIGKDLAVSMFGRNENGECIHRRLAVPCTTPNRMIALVVSCGQTVDDFMTRNGRISRSVRLESGQSSSSYLQGCAHQPANNLASLRPPPRTPGHRAGRTKPGLCGGSFAKTPDTAACALSVKNS